ncbi:MAG: radical SAM protein [Geminicoccaceae bacterium]
MTETGSAAGEDAGPRPPSADGQACGIYVHWPFCKAKCPYCDFNSHVREGVDHERWARALVRELETAAERGFAGNVSSIFFGGGTPSLMDPRTVDAVLSAIHRLWPVDSDVEVTLEANPTSVEAGKFAGFAAAGVNRVSTVQSLDDTSLRFLGREHSAGEARAAVELAMRLYPRVSLDLDLARAGQTVESWIAELDAALAWGTAHLSLYQLTIEPGTRFHALSGAARCR